MLTQRMIEEGGFCTVLHLAAQWGYVRVINVLLVNNADINAEAKGGLTPLMLAAKNNHVDAVKALLSHEPNLWKQATVDKTLSTVLELAYAHAAYESYDLLLNHIEIIEIKRSRLHVNLLSVILQSQINTTIKSTNADWTCTKKILSFLRKHINIYDVQIAIPPLLKINALELLIEYLHGIDLTKIEISVKVVNGVFKVDLLYAACVQGATRCLEWLIKLNIFDVNLKRSSGLTPLTAALSGDHLQATQCLLEVAKADPNLTYTSPNFRQEFTPLALAITCTHAATYIDLLLKHNVNPNIANRTLNVPLLYYIVSDNHPIILAAHLLQNHKTIIDQHAHNLKRPLCVALGLQRVDMAEFLLSKGAAPNFLNGDEASPIYLAVDSGNISAVSLILAHPHFNMNVEENNKPFSLLFPCVYYDYFDIANALLNYNLKLIMQHFTNVGVLEFAVNLGNHRFINAITAHIKQAVIKNILSVDYLNKIAGLAYAYSDKETARALLYAGASPDYVLLNENCITLSSWIDLPSNIPDDATHNESQPTLELKDKIEQSVSHSRQVSAPISYQHTEIVMSARKYLRECMGYTDEAIRQLKETRKRHKQGDPLYALSPLNTFKVCSWNKGTILSNTTSVQPIGGAPNCYLWIPQQLLSSECSPSTLKAFTNRRAKMDGKIIKRLNKTFSFTLSINTNSYSSNIMHELRLHGCKERLLLCSIPSDTNDATLFIGIKYLKNGLHNKADQNALESSIKTSIKIKTEERVLRRDMYDNPTAAAVAAAAAANTRPASLR